MGKPAVAFVVPAHGRVELARVCLRQLARTLAVLVRDGVDAFAVIVGDDENLNTARDLRLETVTAANQPLGRKWNDAYEHACRQGADYVVALGSDDWIDPNLIKAQLDADGEIRCCRLSANVNETGTRLVPLCVRYDGGDGVRMIPTRLLEPLGYRPAEEDRPRAIDTSILRRLTQHLGREPHLTYRDLHPLQIVEFKSPTTQLNSYTACLDHAAGGEWVNPLPALADHYPADAISELRAFYRKRSAALARLEQVQAEVAAWC
jgi:glycosyltransferase involved in cell wall biosynthesis